MTVSDYLRTTTKKLERAGIGTARLDILVLLEDCLNKNRTHLLAHPDLKLTIEQIKWLDLRVARRSKHEPLAYIRGKSEFYGREFIVNKHVLEPRPESETMIELLMNSPIYSSSVSRVRPWKQNGETIVDVGTGSGALAITAKLEFTKSRVVGIDIDPACLAVAKRNAKKHDADITFYNGDLLQPLTANSKPQTTHVPSVLLCNLPYVPDDSYINRAAMNEPRIAIFGGVDGLNLYRRLFAQLNAASWRPRYIFTESLPPQHEKLAVIAASSGFKLTQTEAFIQRFEPLN
jgi:release factor glutamine methyltransferase